MEDYIRVREKMRDWALNRACELDEKYQATGLQYYREEVEKCMAVATRCETQIIVATT